VTVEWKPFDYGNKAETAPPTEVLVWVNEVYYVEGVSLGYFDGFTMRLWSGSDDCSVSHWAPMERPEPPAMERVVTS
jgi:hypothetical protein